MPSNPTRQQKPATRKPLIYVGRALEDYRKLPENIKDNAGRLLLDVQYGETLGKTEPMQIIGDGAIELKVDDKDGWYRVFYVARFEEAVYVLHSFKKKTNKTSPQDIEMGRRR